MIMYAAGISTYVKPFRMAVILVPRYSTSAGFGDNRHTDVIVIVVVTVVIARSVADTGIDVDKYPPAAYQTPK